MVSPKFKISFAVAVIMLCAAAAGPAMAQGRSAENRNNANARFDDSQRAAVQHYYRAEPRSGRCPPGLAKKQNGCMPPGQAKKWEVGMQLPRDVRYYSVPRDVSRLLGTAPEGHKYVRVASDILLITETAGIVMDAILGQPGL